MLHVSLRFPPLRGLLRPSDYDTRSHLGAQEALQRAHRVRNARVCKKRHKGVHLGLDPVVYHIAGCVAIKRIPAAATASGHFRAL